MIEEQIQDILEMLPEPAFISREDRLIWCNAAARRLRLTNCSLSVLLGSQEALLRCWSGEGLLQLTVSLLGDEYDAKVRKLGRDLLFLTSKPSRGSHGDACSAFSDTLRKPLHNLVTAAGSFYEQLSARQTSLQADPALRDASAKMNRSIYQLLRLCGHIYEGGRLLSGQSTADRRSCILNDFLDRFLANCRPLIEASGIRLDYSAPPMPVSADVDTQLLERALYNLLANAMAYTPEGGRISILAEKQDRLFLIHVCDSGEGVHPDVQALLFSSFDPQGSMDPRSGMGLGLSMVRQIAVLHGGGLSIRPNPHGKGTCVSFSLSLARAPISFHSVTVHSDPYSGRHHGLVELADVLPSKLYDPEEVE